MACMPGVVRHGPTLKPLPCHEENTIPDAIKMSNGLRWDNKSIMMCFRGFVKWTQGDGSMHPRKIG